MAKLTIGLLVTETALLNNLPLGELALTAPINSLVKAIKSPPTLSVFTFNRLRTKALRGWHNFNPIDIDMFGLLGQPEDHLLA